MTEFATVISDSAEMNKIEIEVMSFAGVSIHSGTILDYPTAWSIQDKVGQTLNHEPRCSSVPGWNPISGPGLLCDCGAVEQEWRRAEAEAVECGKQSYAEVD